MVKVDDYTVDFILTSPNPILNSQWDTWYIMTRNGRRRTTSSTPTPAAATTPSYASLNANGTGAFIDRKPPARREDRVQGQPELVAQARA